MIFTIEYEGYIDGVPYITDNFDKSIIGELRWEMFKSLSGLTPLQKLIYLVIDGFSGLETVHCEYRIYVRVTSEQIADAINEDVYDVRDALYELEKMKKVSVIKDKDGKKLYMSLILK